MTGDADDERGEEQRRDDRADETQEDLAEDAQLRWRLPGVVPDLGAGDHADEDPERERLRGASPDGEQAMAATRRSITAACYTVLFVPVTNSCLRKWRNWQTR